MKKIKLIISLIILILSFDKLFADGDVFEPVVKIISYKSIFWKHIEEVWKWSAFFVNKEGYIVASSSIIEDEKEKRSSDYYNICLTKDYSIKPDCSYTASLIDFDKNLDIAILKLDTKDIYWNEIDFTKLSFLETDYNYKIDEKDDYYSIGFSSLWSENIEKKKWKFTWTTNYNNHKYLKSDAFISDKYFGWAFVNKDLKLIWIPSVPTWNLLGSGVLYSIDINELKSFIDSNITKAPNEVQKIDNFTKNKILFNKINNELRISDLFLNFSFTKDYEVKKYTEDKWFILTKKYEDDYLINNIKVQLEKNTNIKTEEDFLYYLQNKNFYSNAYHKINKKKIWWIDFYSPIYFSDKSYWELVEYNSYAARVWENIIYIYVNKPVYNIKEEDKKVKANLDKIFNSMNFNKAKINDIKFEFNFNSPKISIWTGASLNDSTGVWINYYWNLSDYFQISLKELTNENWKWKDFEEIYKEDTLWIENDFKSKIKVLWHNGYIYCKKDSIKNRNEEGFTIIQNHCVINIYEWFIWEDNTEYYLNWILISNRRSIVDNLTKTIDYIKENLLLDELWDGETKLSNIYKNIIPLKFKDIKYESDNFKSVLKTLVKYKLIVNGFYYNSDDPVKWKDYVYNYFKYKYNYQFNTKYICGGWKFTCLYKNNYVDINWKKTSLYTIFKEMKIPLDYYVDYEKAKIFNEYIELKLAWINAEYSEEWINKYAKFKDSSIYIEIKEKVDSYNIKTFWDNKVSIYDLIGINEDEDISYFQTRNVYFMIPTLKIFKRDIYKKWVFEFTSKNKINNDYCTGIYINKCYRIMTKSLMIDLLVPEIDFTIYDKSLKK